jgi:hypothetical protein
MDHDFLVNAYKDVVRGDPFIARLLDMMEMVHLEGIHQKISFGLQRTDYLAHWNEDTKQIELKMVM